MGMLTALGGRAASAGPWSIEPIVGLSEEFDTNPLMLQSDYRSEEHVAALLDFPLRYDGDAVEFSIRPYGRLTNSTGYASLASNYAHLDSAAQFTSELGSTSLQADIAKDSSLYYVGALVSGIGVGRTSETASGDWTRFLTERSQLQFDVSWFKVNYDKSAALSASGDNVVDYRYLSGGPTFSYSVNELDTFKVLASFGSYHSLNGITESKSENLQLGYVHPLSEIWSLAVNAGYSQSTNSEKILNQLLYYLYGVVEYEAESSMQKGTVYSATLTRQGERVSLSASVARALQPTGFAFLSETDSVNFSATYTQSERWDYLLSSAWQKSESPEETGGVAQFNVGQFDQHYFNVQVVANWHWTPEWIVSLRAIRITQQYGPPAVNSASTGINLDISRHFLQTEL